MKGTLYQEGITVSVSIYLSIKHRHAHIHLKNISRHKRSDEHRHSHNGGPEHATITNRPTRQKLSKEVSENYLHYQINT